MSRCADAAASWWQGKPGIEFKKIEPERAIRLCEAAARETPDNGDAWAFLARAYNKANRHTTALRATEKAIELGSPAGLWLRGEQFRFGLGVNKNFTKAVSWYHKAAQQGYSIAQYNLGNHYYFGKGVKKDVSKATAWYRKAAEQGYAPAQYNLGRLYEFGKGVKKDVSKAAAWYRKAAEQGYARAQYNLGELYEFGKGVKKDVSKAAAWYRKAAEQGYARAQYNLGDLYEFGKGVKKDVSKAAAWYRKAAEQGYAPAQTLLGTLYYYGKGVSVKKNVSKAAAWYRKAAERGSAPAQTLLGTLYSEGKGVEKDFARAEAWYRKAAKQGYAPAQTSLGTLYYYGQGVKKDVSKAAAWYRKAAQQGYPEAQGMLGYLYELGEGKGVEKDFARAAAWYRKAAKQGYAIAQYNLGNHYYFGKGVKKDVSKAAAWYRKAAQQGYPEAQGMLGYLYELGEGKGVEKDFARAAAWYRKAAKQGYAPAQTSLGDLYEFGKGVKKDVSKAAAWYRKAAEQGHPEAQDMLGDLYLRGNGVKKDVSKAAAWYRKAAEQGHPVAQDRLGDLYLRGNGVKKDLARAAAWYRKAAKQGYAPAQTSLGTLYYFGQGVKKDVSKAAAWYRKAAQQGYPEAQGVLGYLYELGEGKGVEKDFARAAAWYRKAAEQGHPEAQTRLGDLYLRGNGVKKDLAQAAAWYRKAAEQGHPEAQFMMGVLYHGEGSQLIPLLEYHDPTTRWEAIRALRRIGERRAIEPITARLSDVHMKVREQAILALAEFGERSAVDPMLKQLNDSDPSIRDLVAKALNDLGAASASPALRKILINRTEPSGDAILALTSFGEHLDTKILADTLVSDLISSNDRIKLVDALIVMSDRRVVPHLIDALKSGRADVARNAAATLSRFGGPETLKPILKYYNHDGYKAYSALTQMGHTVGQELIAMDKRGQLNSGLALVVMEIITRFRVQSVKKILIKQSIEDNKYLKNQSLKALARLGDEWALELLSGAEVEKLLYGDHSLPPYLIELFSKWSDTRASKALVHKLIELIASDDDDVRARAQRALVDLRHQETIKSLKTLTNHGTLKVRVAAAEALAILGEPESFFLLLADNDKKVRDEVKLRLKTLLSVHDKVLPCGSIPILSLFTDGLARDEKSRALLVAALVGLRESDPTEKLVALLTHEDANIRTSGSFALAELGDLRAVEPLIEFLSDASEKVRREAVIALGELGDSRAVGPLIGLVSGGDVTPKVRREAVIALGELGDSRAIAPLMEVWSIHIINSGLLEHAVIALGKLGVQRAIKLLLKRVVSKNSSPFKDIVKGLNSLQKWRSINSNAARDVLLKLDPLRDETARQVLRERATVPSLLSLLSEAEDYRPSVLFFTQTIGERGAYRQRLQLLEQLWRWRYDPLGVSIGRLAEDMRLLRPSLGESEKMSPYTHLLASILASHNKNHAVALEWAERGLAHSSEEDRAVRVALSVMRAEALVALGNFQQAKEMLQAADTETKRLMPMERVGYLSLVEVEVLMTRAYISSKLGETQKAVNTNYAAEELLKTALRLGWIREDMYERLYEFRIAPIQQHALKIEAERYRQDALNSLQREPRGVQEEYGRDLMLQAQIVEAIKSGDPDSYAKVQKEVEKTALAAMPQAEGVRFADINRQRVYDRLVSLQKQVAVLERKFKNAERNKQDKQEDNARKWRKEWRKKQRAFHEFIRTLKKKHPDIAAMWGKSPTELAQLSKNLNPHTGIVQYLLLDERSYAFVMRHDGSVEIEPLRLGGRDVGRRCPKSQAGKIPCFDLKRKVNRYRALLDSQSKERIEERKRLGETLSRVFLEPIAEHIEGLSHLILVPNGILHRLPFAALPWEGGYLVEHKVLTLLPASSLVGALLAKPVDNPRGMLALGNPVVGESGWRELKWAEAEVDALVKYFPDLSPKHKRILKKEKAHRDSLVDQDLEGYLLHLATHGESGKKNREARLLLSGGDLTYADVIGLSIKDAPLVVLSACETGLGERLSGDEVYSLANAFLHAQARAVVFSLWLVNDPATSMLMGEFYSHYASKGDVATSLAEAQRTMIRKGRPPAHWAGFVLSQWSAPKS